MSVYRQLAERQVANMKVGNLGNNRLGKMPRFPRYLEKPMNHLKRR
jgi:hypothetical protein